MGEGLSMDTSMEVQEQVMDDLIKVRLADSSKLQ